jgi:Spy/CpxP family protein refolding chaperone
MEDEKTEEEKSTFYRLDLTRDQWDNLKASLYRAQTIAKDRMEKLIEEKDPAKETILDLFEDMQKARQAVDLAWNYNYILK